jgi:protein-disulfide isomerase-like protein with CxxC motif
VPFSLGQVHVEPGESSIWDRPQDDTGILALQAAVVVRDQQPGHFLAVHRAMFEARHADGAQLRDPGVVRDLLLAGGADPDAVLDEIATGRPLATVRREHEGAAADLDVWGVPTFMAHGRAAFVRLMELPVDAADARRTVERCVALLEEWPALNEFKHTSLER